MTRRARPLADGLEQWSAMTRACFELMRAGLRAADPSASEATIRRRLAARLARHRAEKLRAYRQHG